jgi:hypothetical protein
MVMFTYAAVRIEYSSLNYTKKVCHFHCFGHKSNTNKLINWLCRIKANENDCSSYLLCEIRINVLVVSI